MKKQHGIEIKRKHNQWFVYLYSEMLKMSKPLASFYNKDDADFFAENKAIELGLEVYED